MIEYNNIINYESNILKTEEILEYTFKDKNLILSAISHPSYFIDHRNLNSYERLEFLGDSILGFIVAEHAYKMYPNMHEGQLTHVKTAIVSGNSLSATSLKLGFNKVIIFGKSEESTGRRGIKNALENVFESCVAALYLDGGYEIAKNFVYKHLLVKMKVDGNLGLENNPKSILQEKLQASKKFPVYQIIREYGPAHDKVFVAQVLCDKKVLAKGSGKTKKEAECNAASLALNVNNNEG